MHFTSETFSQEERAILETYFTNTTLPVFGLINLPEVVKAALFARYSRTSKSLRRLFLDEFYEDLGLAGGPEVGNSPMGLRRAEKLFERVISDYGDDSVAQLGGVHLACEQASNLLTKVIERGRLMSYLEQSTRYLDYGSQDDTGRYRFQTPPELDGELDLRDQYHKVVAELFGAYNAINQGVFASINPSSADKEEVRAARAASFDASRGLLPASTLSNLGVFGSPQGFEALVMRMRASEYGEARQYGEMIRDELMRVIPSFLSRLDRPDRGGAWVRYLVAQKSIAGPRVVLNPSTVLKTQGPSVRLVGFDADGQERILLGILFELYGESYESCRDLLGEMSLQDRTDLFWAYVGDRKNRRHKPGRAFELTRYDFEIVCDYGAFRDLQRHRMLSISWAQLNTGLGYRVPGIVGEAGLGSRYAEAMDGAVTLGEAIADRLGFAIASYVVPMGYHIRFQLSMNAREAMHLIELRSQPAGHSSYRLVAQEMHNQIRNIAGQNLVSEAMSYVDHKDYAVGRLEAEKVASRKRAKLS